MGTDLDELMAEARREVRVAAGLPPSEAETEAEYRRTAIAEMDSFVYHALHLKVMKALRSQVIWTAAGATTQFTAEGRAFHLRKIGVAYGLFAVEGDEERKLIVIEASDPIFKSRLLTAIGASLAIEPPTT